jgi:hypothetical protein
MTLLQGIYARSGQPLHTQNVLPLTCLMKISLNLLWPKGLYFRLNLSNLRQQQQQHQQQQHEHQSSQRMPLVGATDPPGGGCQPRP